MSAWIAATRGIRYREHDIRKHGQRPDRYWSIRYKVNGRSVHEAVGWWSKGVTQAQCVELLAQLRRNHRSGGGPQTLRELREFEEERLTAEAAAREADKLSRMTVAEFQDDYFARLRLTATSNTVYTSISYLNTWLSDLKDMPLARITTDDLERLVVRPMLRHGMSPGSIERALATFSAMWSDAKQLGLVSGRNPRSKVSQPKVDNRRERFLSQSEAARLLAALKEESIFAHDMALLSLFAGLRAGECMRLTWGDIDFDSGIIFVKDTKNKHNRHANITQELNLMLAERYQRQPKSEWVIVGENGGHSKPTLSKYFGRAVKALGLNDGVDDRRQRVCFHTLRHTFASWLVQMGKPLYTVSKLLGHRSIRWTERYAHLAPDAQKVAALKLEGVLNHSGEAMLRLNEGK